MISDTTNTQREQRSAEEQRKVDTLPEPPPRRGRKRKGLPLASDHVAREGTREQALEQALTLVQELTTSNQELRDANQELRDENEALRLREEEAQASAEEVKMLNEELQATNEELETLNEEMEATLEELRTTNDDLQARTQELEDLVAQRGKHEEQDRPPDGRGPASE